MKKQIYIALFFLYFSIAALAQNAIVGDFSTGWGGACGNNSDFTFLGPSAGSSYIVTRTVGSTGDKYWRFGVDWGGTIGQYTITPGSDVTISPGTTYSLNMTCTTSGSLKYNVSNTSYNYIFKTLNAGSNPTGTFVFFEVQGTVQSVSSVSQNPTSGNVFPGQDVTVTANLSGSLSTGQDLYLRYSIDNFSTSTVLKLTGSGTSYSAIIPGSTNTPSENIKYYVFSSGPSNVAANGSNADLYTINLNNNSGSNYSYTVATGWTTNADGNWGTAGTWTANAVPSTTLSMGAVTINHNVVMNQNATLSSLSINSSKILEISSGFTLTTTGASSIDGTIRNAGTMAVSGGSWTFTSTGKYQHNYATTAGTIPSATWNAGSTCEIIGYTTYAASPGGPANRNQSFSNFTWNCTNQTANINFGGTIPTVNKDFNITSTNTGILRLSAGTNYTFNVGGNFNISSGNLEFTSSSATVTINISGNYSQVGGIVDFASGSTQTPTVTMNLAGNFSNSAGSSNFKKSDGSGSGKITFNKSSGSQTFSSTNISTGSNAINIEIGTGSTTNTVILSSAIAIHSGATFIVFAGSALEMGDNVLTGGTFTLNSDATLKIGHANGIRTQADCGSGATCGNVQTSTRNFNTNANYEYNGTVAQVTGNALPSSINTLTINNSNGVSLTSGLTINNLLTLINGRLTIASNNLVIENAASISGTLSASNMIVVTGTGELRKVFTGNGSFTFPVGDNTGSAEYSPVYINLTASGYSSAYIGIKLLNQAHASLMNSPADKLIRYWTVTSAGLTNPSYNADFYYLDADITGTETNLIGARYVAGTGWLAFSPVDAGNNKIYVTGQSVFGDFTAAGQNAFSYTTVSTGLWTTNSNWNCNCQPPTGALVVINNNPITLNQNVTLSSITINPSAVLNSENGQSRILTILTGGSFINNGTYTANDGKLIFAGSGAVSGIVAFNNVDISGGVDFGANSTINGILSLNNGGYVNTNAPIYGNGSTLKYTSDFELATEWYANAASGQGVPYNVIIDGGNVYSKTDVNVPRYLRGSLTINTGKSFSLSQTAFGDLYVAADWTNNGTFNANDRKVTFNGTTAQNINTATNFGYVTIDNNTTFNADISIKFLLINSGKTFASQSGSARTLTIANGGSITNNGTFIPYDGWVTFLGNNTITGTIEFYNTSIENNGVDFGTASTIKNILLINQSGFVNINAPTYAEGSTLKYWTNSLYNRRVEWSAQTGRGYPWHVQLSNNTILNLGYESPAVQKGCAGNLTIDANSALYMDYNTDDMTEDLVVKGNLILNGTLSLSDAIGGDMEIYGNWSRTGTFNPKGRLVTFKGTANQTINNTTTFDYFKIENSGGAVVSLADNISISQAATVESGAILNLATYVLSGAGSFDNKAGGTIKIGSLQGITSSGATGNIQTTTRIFNGAGIYHYIGAANQISGNGLPATILNTGKVIIDMNTLATTFSASQTTRFNTGATLEIKQGTVNDDGSNFFDDETLNAGNLTMSGGLYKFNSNVTFASAVRYPRLSGTYSLSGGIIELAANLTSSQYQHVNGGKTYYNLKFSGASVSDGFKRIPSTITIINNLEITGATTIVDFGSNSVTGTAGITMNGGRLRISSLNSTLPELTGTYNLTGGTIELYGSGASQTQSLRGGVTYYNADINATATSNNPANVVLNSTASVAGTLTVNNPASFQISNLYSITGTGNFVVNSGATFQYGSADGINTSTTTGNIRVSGTRTLSASANYGFIGGVEMVSGNQLPATVNNLFINKTGTTNVTLSQDISVSGKLNLLNGVIISDATKLLTLNDGTTVHSNYAGNNNEPGSANSFIKGPLKKIGNDAFIFPTGDIQGTNYVWAPIGIEAPSDITDAYTAKYNFVSPNTDGYPNWADEDGSNIGEGLHHASGIEYWMLNRDAGTSTPAVTLFWKDAARSDIANNGSEYTQLADLTVAHWNSTDSKWVNMGGTATGTFPSGQITSSISFTNYSPITFGSKTAKNPLPVNLIDFSGKCIDGNINLYWKTLSEINNDFFDIQNSEDGINFKSIGTCKGQGNSNTLVSYSYYYQTSQTNNNYFRLMQYDYNGNSSFSETISINCAANETNEISSFSLVQTTHELNISFYSYFNQKINFSIYDICGKKIYSNSINILPGFTSHPINISNFTSGIYFFNASYKKNIFSSKIVINN